MHDDEGHKGYVRKMRGKDARELPPQSIAFSGQKSDNGDVLESETEVTTRR